MSQIIALLIPAIFLFIYLILSSIEFGSSVFLVFPKILDDKTIKTYINPVWETTNVFLVFFVVSMFTFFPGSNYFFGTYLLTVFFTTLVVLGIRIVCMLILLYTDIRLKLIDITLMVTSFLAPIIFSLAYIYMLTGQITGQILSPTYLSLILLVIASIVLISGNFFAFFKKSRSKEIVKLNQFSFIAFVCAVILFFLALTRSAAYLFSNPGSNTLMLLALAICAIAYIIAWVFGGQLSKFLSACLNLGGVFFGLILLHLPFIIYPNITIYNSFTDPASFKLLMVAFVVGSIFVLPSLYLLYSLFAAKYEA